MQLYVRKMEVFEGGKMFLRYIAYGWWLDPLYEKVNEMFTREYIDIEKGNE